MTELENYIKTYFDIDDAFVTELAAFFKVETLSKNEYHTEVGGRHARLSFVKSGYLRVFRQEDQKEVTQWISSPGEFATDLSAIMFGQPARWNIQAMTECTCYSISASDYTKIPEQIPNWTSIEKLFLAKCFMTIEDRVYSFLSMSAEERYQYFFQYKKELFLNTPQQYIASMLGMSPETLSRIRNKAIS